MSFRNRYLFIIVILGSLLGFIYQWKQHYKEADSFDPPKILSGNKETILVRQEKRDCVCPDWLQLKTGKDSTVKTFIYIEPSSAALQIPQNYDSLKNSGYALNLEGEFYKTETIPYGYEQHGDQKPERARVFYYTAIQLVKQE